MRRKIFCTDVLPIATDALVQGVKQFPLFKRPYFARRVLDIGAGHNPFRGVTHVLEIDVHRGSQRDGKRLVLPGGARLIVGDVQALPFRHGRFDYVYASHVLEHVDSPELACREIMRIAHAGYIETPSPFLEQGLALTCRIPPEYGFHKWFVFSPRSGLLTFEPKTAETAAQFCTCPDGRVLKEFYASLDFQEAQHFFRRSTKTTVFYWQTSFDVDVRETTTDCRRAGRACRFLGMRAAVMSNCNDPIGAPRLLRLRKMFPDCRDVLRRHGHRTLFF